MKRKTLLLLWLLAMMLAPGLAFGQSTHEWGSSSTNSGNSTYANPFGRYFGWEYRVYLYQPNTMNGVSGNITKLEFLPYGSMSSSGGQIDVWMKSVTDITSLSSSTTFATYKSGATLVYSNSSSPSYTSGSYVSIPLSTPIAYNYSNNEYLMILVRSVANNSSGDGSSNFYHYNPANASNNTWSKKQDSSDPGQNVSGTTGAYLPVIRVTYTNSGSSYITEINSNTDWNNFAQSVRNGLDYSGKTVNLRANISINSQSNQAGSNGNLFKGTFDGHGNTITVNMTATGDYCAPFYAIQNATINNLAVSGSITSSYHDAAGFCGGMYGNSTFNNCLSNVNITSTRANYVDTRSACGGFAGRAGGGDNPTFVGCAFTGSLSATSAKWGGFIGFHASRSGWAGDYGGCSTFTNCICAPTSITTNGITDNATFTSGYNQNQYLIMTVTNSYYNEEAAKLGTKQGTRAYTITGQSPVTVAMAGAPTTQYSVSGIKVYNPGITLTDNGNTTIYAANGNTVSLTLSGGSVYQADHGNLSGSSNPYTLGMTANNTIISTIISYTITATPNPPAGGSVTGGGQYINGSSVTVTASANSGYCFSNWTENGTEVSTNSRYTFTVSGNRNLVANFVSMDANNITVSGTSVACGNSTTLTASGLTGVTYNWYSDAACTNLVASGSTYTTPTLTDNITYYVKAVKQSETIEQDSVFQYTGSAQTYNVPTGAESLKLEVWGAQGGNNSNGDGGKGGYSVGMLNNLDGISSINVYVGQQPSSTTGGWNGGGGYSSYGTSGGGGTDIRLNANTIYDRIIVAGGGGGRGYSSTSGGYGGGQNGGAGGSGSATSGGAGGTQTSGGASGTGGSGSGYAGTYGSASSETSHNGGGGGGGWYGGGSGVGSGTDAGGGGGSGYVWTSSTYSSAPSGYSVSSSYYLTDAQTIGGDATMPNPAGGTMTGREGDGYARITAYITETCESEVKAVTVTVTMPAAPTNVQVTNIGLTTATASWSGSASSYKWSIDGGSTWNTTSNTTVNLSGLTMGQSYTFRVKAVSTGTCESSEVTAPFTTLSTFNVTATANPTAGGTVSINNGTPGTNVTEACNANSTVTLTATAATGYTFQNWTEGGTVVSSNASFTINNLAAARTLVANFTQAVRIITVSADPAGTGTVSGGGNYFQGASCTVTAQANAGYSFQYWHENGNPTAVSTDATYTFTVTGDRSLVAHFDPDRTLTTYATPVEGGWVTADVASTIGTITVGTGTATISNTPYATGSYKSYQQCLYKANEINGSGWITSISYEIKGNTNVQTNHIEIYMKNSSLTSFAGTNNSNFETVTASNKVFDGDWTITNVDGWSTIILDTPFYYDGTSSLMIGIHENTNQNSTANFVYTSVNYTRLNTYGPQNTCPDPNPLDPSTFNASGLTKARGSERANVRLGFGTYHNGESVALTAHANPGYQFTGWTVDGTADGNTNPYTVTMNANHNVVANFEARWTFVHAGNWNVPTNWLPVGQPGASDDVYIEAAAIIPANCTAEANTVTINSGGTITIADGGQLKHNNTGVVATVQRNVTAYGAGNAQTRLGYILYTSPVTSAVTNFTGIFAADQNDHEDLYYFDYSHYNNNELKEWVRVNNSASEVIPHVPSGYPANYISGYIYARQNGTTISTPAGTVRPSNSNYNIPLRYTANGTERFNGWNLIGNPFVCNAYMTAYDGNNNELNYYVLNGNGDEFTLASSTNAVGPTGAIMVKATGANQQVVSSRTVLVNRTGILNVDVASRASRGTTGDRARLRFGNGVGLEKFQFDPSHTRVSIPVDGTDYAVVYVEPAGEVPVNFKAEENGHYTLSFSTEDVNFNYLHLIDNMTGADVDLLAGASTGSATYTFNAKTTDYESRFKIVFAASDDSEENSEAPFAFYSNGVWVINNEGDATLQVIDVLGHVLSSDRISGATTKAIDAAPGVYMFRLINGDSVRVQKIVVKR